MRTERDGTDLPAWPAWTGLVVLVAGFSLTIFLAVLVAGIAGVAGTSTKDLPPGVTLADTFVQDAALIGTAYLVVRLTGEFGPRSFGLRTTALRPAVLWVVLAAVAYVAFSVAYAQVFDIKAKDDLPSQLGADDSTFLLVGVIVLVVIVAPIAEELVFRATLFVPLWRRVGLWPAALITGLIFGAVHAASAPAALLVQLAVLGLLLCLLRWRTGSLLPCSVLHSLNNAYAFGTLEHWSVAGTVALMAASTAAVLTLLAPFVTRSTPG